MGGNELFDLFKWTWGITLQVIQVHKEPHKTDVRMVVNRSPFPLKG